jgi:hypothetical protein
MLCGHGHLLTLVPAFGKCLLYRVGRRSAHKCESDHEQRRKSADDSPDGDAQIGAKTPAPSVRRMARHSTSGSPARARLVPSTVWCTMSRAARFVGMPSHSQKIRGSHASAAKG